MSKFRNVGANPLCLRGGREVVPGEVFTFGEYHREAHREFSVSSGHYVEFPPETGDELDPETLQFWFKVGGVEAVDDSAVSQIVDEVEFAHESNG